MSLFDYMMDLLFKYFDLNKYGDIMSRVINDVDVIC